MCLNETGNMIKLKKFGKDNCYPRELEHSCRNTKKKEEDYVGNVARGLVSKSTYFV